MIPAPWNVVFTILFATTALICIVHLFVTARGGAHARHGREPRVFALSIDIGHLAMSAGMILMTWVMILGPILTWGQVALFSLFGLLALGGVFTATSVGGRIDYAGHVVLHAAMVWMLAAMPLLMSGPSSAGHGGHGGHDHAAHGDHGAHAAMSGGPVWVDIVNGVFVAASFLVAAWWLVRPIRGDHRRWHALCHILMAAGMGAMLLAMNG